MKINRFLLVFFLLFSLSSCEDFLEEDPTRAGGIMPDDVFAAYDKAYAALIGSYDELSHYYFDGLSTVICADVIADDMLINSEGNYNWFVSTYQLNVLPNYNDAYNPWRRGYVIINNANNLIAYGGDVPDATQEQRDFLQGQGYALRAYTYQRLVQMYAPAYQADPNAQGLILRTEPTSDDLPRSTVQETFDLIFEDLDRAEKLLSYDNSYKGFLDKRAIHALKARTYLLVDDWENAAKYAEAAIMGTIEGAEDGAGEVPLMTIAEWINAGFALDLSESLFTIDYLINDHNTYLTIPSFYYPAFGYSSVRANNEFVDIFSDDDKRKLLLTDELQWSDGTPIDPDNFCIMKFMHNQQIGDAKLTKIRVSEMYLIWAEAEAELGNDSEAAELVSHIMRRANSLAKIPSETGEDLINVIINERRRELFGEGFRWFDIKRRQAPYTRTGDHWVKYEFGPNDHDYYRLTYPIPQYEIDANSAITEADQNVGY